LSLDNTQITDEGLRHLIVLKNLASLSLNNAQVTDEGLRHLIGLKDLAHLKLKNTQVTDEGKMALKKALPSCRFTFD
jgi:hypothetical protein